MVVGSLGCTVVVHMGWATGWAVPPLLDTWVVGNRTFMNLAIAVARERRMRSPSGVSIFQGEPELRAQRVRQPAAWENDLALRKHL